MPDWLQYIVAVGCLSFVMVSCDSRQVNPKRLHPLVEAACVDVHHCASSTTYP